MTNGILTDVQLTVCHACRDSTFKVKDKLFYLTLPTTKKEEQCLVGLFGLWRQHIPHLGVLFCPINQMTWNSASFVRALDQEKDLQQVWAAVQAAVSLGPYVPPDLMALEISGRQECSLEPL